jgi:pyoverdine/dityrosine biosynthesis protein Dit1
VALADLQAFSLLAKKFPKHVRISIFNQKYSNFDHFTSNEISTPKANLIYQIVKCLAKI